MDIDAHPTEPDDPGRDPAGLDPPRDLLDATGGIPEHGSYTPERRGTPAVDTAPDQPPTSTEGGGP